MDQYALCSLATKTGDIQLKSTGKTEMKGMDLELNGLLLFLGSTFEMIWQVRAKG